MANGDKVDQSQKRKAKASAEPQQLQRVAGLYAPPVVDAVALKPEHGINKAPHPGLEPFYGEEGPTMVQLPPHPHIARALGGESITPEDGAVNRHLRSAMGEQEVRRKPEYSTNPLLHNAFGNNHRVPSGLTTNPLLVQAKLTVNQPDDPQEREADQAAEKVVQRKALTSPPPEEGDGNAQPNIQKKGPAAGGTEAPEGIGERLDSSKGKGAALPEDTQTEMGSALGADFSDVRVHTGAESNEMSRDLNAQAFTHGNDIYFNEGKYDPNSTDGQRLLAHELTHTVQQGASPQIQRSVASTAPAGDAPLPVTDISFSFKPNAEVAAYLDKQHGKWVEVPVKIGDVASGTIRVRQESKAKGTTFAVYNIDKNQALAYTGVDFFNRLGGAGFEPVIAVPKGKVNPDAQLAMYFTFRKGDAVGPNAQAFVETLNKNLAALGMAGFKEMKVPTVQNTVMNGELLFTVSGMQTNVGGFLDAEGAFGLQGKEFTFDVGVRVNVKGLADGEFHIQRLKTGAFAGEGEIAASIANVTGKVKAQYTEDGDVRIQGSVRIESEKFSGELSLMVADKGTADAMMHNELGIETAAAQQEGKESAPPEQKKEAKTKQNQVVSAWGHVEARITSWLVGKANIGIDSEGHVTIIGEIAPPSEVVLMEQQGKKIDLFKLEAKGGYGIPLVGQVGLFVSLGMFINAGFGPLTLRNIALKGTYSTDPSVLQNFTITGSLNISAFAIIGLEAEAGLFLTLLGHDIKAGINLTAAAGIRAYAEVTPTFEYREQASAEGGKVGEAWLKGHFEAAAQLFLKLSGEFFVELDSPWWSPAPDDRWPYPLFDVEYPLGESIGIGGDVNWLVGSPDYPELKFSPVEFDPDKFTSDIMKDPPPKKGGGKGGEQKGDGKWDDGSAQGGKEDQPEMKKDGPGLKGKKEEEDVSKLSDEQKYMRACSQIGTIGDEAKAKPLAMVQLQEKVRKVKAKYGIERADIKPKGDGLALVTVKHRKESNAKAPIEVRLMSAAEMMKLAKAGQDDLLAQVKAKEDPKAKTMKETDARAIAEAVKEKHYVFESVEVAQKGEQWIYELDVAGKKQAVPGSGVEKPAEPAGADPKKAPEKLLPVALNVKEEEGFSLKGKGHTLTIVVDGSGMQLLMASESGTLLKKVRAFKTAVDAAIKTMNATGNAPVISKATYNKDDIQIMQSDLGDLEAFILKKTIEISTTITQCTNAILQIRQNSPNNTRRIELEEKAREKLEKELEEQFIADIIERIKKFFIDHGNFGDDFAFDLVDLNPHLTTIANQIAQIDKHVLNVDVGTGGTALGRGFAYDAYAAEKEMGWVAGRAISVVQVEGFKDLLDIAHNPAVPENERISYKKIFDEIDKLAKNRDYDAAGERFAFLINYLSSKDKVTTPLPTSEGKRLYQLFVQKFMAATRAQHKEEDEAKATGKKSVAFGKPFAHAIKVKDAQANLKKAREDLDNAINKFGLTAVLTIARMDSENRTIEVVKDGKKGHKLTVTNLITEADRILKEIEEVDKDPKAYLTGHTDKHGVDLYSIFEADLAKRTANAEYLRLMEKLYGLKVGDAGSVGEFSKGSKDDE